LLLNGFVFEKENKKMGMECVFLGKNGCVNVTIAIYGGNAGKSTSAAPGGVE
jgi:hypothetical protein